MAHMGKDIRRLQILSMPPETPPLLAKGFAIDLALTALALFLSTHR
jgi:hypothetical protein